MNRFSRHRTAGPLVGALVLWLAVISGLPVVAQEEPGGDSGRSDSNVPKDITIQFDGQFKQTADGEVLFTGPVTILWKSSRVQADRLSMRDKRFIEAEGNVLFVWEGNRIYGSRMTYDLETETGMFEDAMGFVSGDYIFWAKSAEKIGENTVLIKNATVTTCTQPSPFWSFRVSSATITVGQYARMWNVRFKTSKVPLIYLPYIVWPVKEDRAAGLLFPEIQNTETRGRAISAEVFIPLGRSADVTLLGRHYSKAGFGGGGEFRFVPNQLGAASLNGFFIDDKVVDQDRYRVTYQQTQAFLNGFRMVADMNFVSDFNYFSDFERDLDVISSPTILARLEFSRNGAWTSINARDLRREQLFSDGTELVQSTYPEIELRGRSRKLGRTPFYLSFESSVANINQQGVQQGLAIDADYLRADLFPTISMPLSRVPWLEINPQVRYRFTHWTQFQELDSDPDTGDPIRNVASTGLTRGLWGAGLDIVGPKLVRIFNRKGKEGATRYKNLIEPRIVYGFQDQYEDRLKVLVYDEVDTFSGAGNQVAYSLTTRLFAQRPRAKIATSLDRDPMELIRGSDELATDLSVESNPEFLKEVVVPEYDTSVRPEAVEIASLEIRQRRSFDTDLSFADLDGDGTRESTSAASAVELTGRYNPSPLVSLDVRSDYDILHKQIRSVNFSGGVSNQLARVRFSLFHRNGLGVSRVTVPDDMGGTMVEFQPNKNDTQMRLTTGFGLFGGKLHLDLDGSINFNPEEGQRTIPDRRVRATWSTQCCTVVVESLKRSFPGLSDRDDLYFRIDLTGIGKIFDVNY